MTFAQNNANPKTPELVAKELRIQFIHKATEESGGFVKRELINMLEICGPTNTGRLTMPETASVASFSGQSAVGELCSTPSHYTEPP